MEVKLGQIVKSTAGRDQDRFFAVVGIEGEYLFLADGKVRKLDRPKRKKKKHVGLTSQFLQPDDGTVTDKKLRKVLGELNREGTETNRKEALACQKKT